MGQRYEGRHSHAEYGKLRLAKQQVLHDIVLAIVEETGKLPSEAFVIASKTHTPTKSSFKRAWTDVRLWHRTEAAGKPKAATPKTEPKPKPKRPARPKAKQAPKPKQEAPQGMHIACTVDEDRHAALLVKVEVGPVNHPLTVQLVICSLGDYLTLCDRVEQFLADNHLRLYDESLAGPGHDTARPLEVGDGFHVTLQQGVVDGEHRLEFNGPAMPAGVPFTGFARLRDAESLAGYVRAWVREVRKRRGV